MKKNKPQIVLSDLEVVDISTEGKAIAKSDGLVVFIEGAVPGDVVDVLVHKKKSSFAEGRVKEFKKYSEQRVKPRCRHFGTCGGCKWQDLSYERQLDFKQKYVEDAFVRLGKLEFTGLQRIRANADAYHYRNKLEFSFSNKRWLSKEEMTGEVANRNALGFHIPGLFDKVLDVTECHLQNELSDRIRNEVRRYAMEKGLTFMDIREKNGFLRTLMIRTTSIGETMVVLAVYEWKEIELFALLEHLKLEFPGITSLQYLHSNKANDTFTGLEIKTYAGKDHIIEEMEGLRFRISARSFYQTNSLQAYELYKIARDFAGLKETDVVYDLYTGTGTIANFVAGKCKKVVGVEYVEDSIIDARVNSRENGIKNTVFYAGDMKDVLNEGFLSENGRPDVIITDPPRAGMHEDVVKVMLKAAPEKIVYISCNPSTQARDLALMQNDYAIVRVQPVDMFPQTAHVENVVLLARK